MFIRWNIPLLKGCNVITEAVFVVDRTYCFMLVSHVDSILNEFILVRKSTIMINGFVDSLLKGWAEYAWCRIDQQRRILRLG
ncbi:hypothetical protein RIF29_30139 [Crotalaria pallida]|uniref:Uncharacterized protein n=1 Tax=Crotalaria pallida TaxID=3830 RepID=A0AAN9EMM5_CROPI